jgi:hypothetical protein
VTSPATHAVTALWQARPVTPDAAPAPEPAGRRRPLSPVDAALIAEACSRRDLVWLRPAWADRPKAAWHVWHDDAVCVVTGSGEQPLPALAGEVEVIARSKENGTRVVNFVAEATAPDPETEEWDGAARALAAARLNATDPAQQRRRWATEGRIVLLRPVAVSAAGPGDDDSPSGAAPPPGGPGTTVGSTPFHLGTRARRAARLRRRRG